MPIVITAASGGGGGGGQVNGPAGSNGSAVGTNSAAYGPDSPPSSGTFFAPGAGSSSSNVNSTGPGSGLGGAGGALGLAGFPGQLVADNSQFTSRSAAGAGGVAGNAIVGGANITWYAHATRLGTFDSLGTNMSQTTGEAGQIFGGGSAGAGG